jgi:nucleotide-binding universal stress UspA family protein
MSRIVVGIDGSDEARRALRLAIAEARLRGAALEVVHVVPDAVMLANPVLIAPPPEEKVHAFGREAIDRSLSEVDTEGLEVERTVLRGQAARGLCESARGAELLVVGSRGLGGFKGLMAGSVTHQVVAHAPCPVLVVVPESRSNGS